MCVCVFVIFFCYLFVFFVLFYLCFAVVVLWCFFFVVVVIVLEAQTSILINSEYPLTRRWTFLTVWHCSLAELIDISSFLPLYLCTKSYESNLICQTSLQLTVSMWREGGQWNLVSSIAGTFFSFPFLSTWRFDTMSVVSAAVCWPGTERPHHTKGRRILGHGCISWVVPTIPAVFPEINPILPM